MLETTSGRPAGDILSRTVRVRLGGVEYPLRVLFIAGNERWRAYQDERTSAWVEDLASKGNDTEAITAAFATETDMWLDLLYAYDTDCGKREGVLPPRDQLKESIFEDEPELAIREVVKAANPKATAAVERLVTAALQTSDSSQPTSTSPTPTAGRSKRSAKH